MSSTKVNDTVSISVIAMTHNRRDNIRIDNFLNSVFNQTVLPVEVIIVDTSGTISDQTRELCEYYGAVYTHKPQTEFNKSKALNYAIKYALGHYVMCADIDMMFEPMFLEKVFDKLSENDNNFVLAQCGYLIRIPSDQWLWNWKILETEIDKGRLSKKHSPGAIQAVKKGWLWKVRGYDEKYVGLGGMDNDMIDRATRDGLNVAWIEFEDVQCYHQPHEISAMKGESSGLFLQEKTVERNIGGWGNL